MWTSCWRAEPLFCIILVVYPIKLKHLNFKHSSSTNFSSMVHYQTTINHDARRSQFDVLLTRKLDVINTVITSVENASKTLNPKTQILNFWTHWITKKDANICKWQCKVHVKYIQFKLTPGKYVIYTSIICMIIILW